MAFRTALICFSTLVYCSFSAVAQPLATAETPSFLTLTNLADQAPVVAVITVKKTATLKAERAPGLENGWARLYVEAEVSDLIRGDNGIEKAIRYLVDVPRTDRGKVPKLKKRKFIIFARQQPARPGELQLIGRDAQLAWTPSLEPRTRNMISNLLSIDAPPRITNVREALHVRGNLQGEGETQIFLATANDNPVSLTILRRPGVAPQWAVSLTEIVDEAASVPRQNTLLWYRLACFLPEQMPVNALVSSNAAENALAIRDYNFVRDQLGPCDPVLR